MARVDIGAVLPGKTKKIHLRYAAENNEVRDLKVYATASEDEAGRLVELSLKAGKFGSTESGLLNALAVTASLGLQHGVPVEALIAEWRGLRFDPQGTTSDKDDPFVGSIVDAVARWLARRYVAASSE